MATMKSCTSLKVGPWVASVKFGRMSVITASTESTESAVEVPRMRIVCSKWRRLPSSRLRPTIAVVMIMMPE